MGQAQRQASPGKLLEALRSPYSAPRLHRELFHIIKPPILSLGTVCSLCIRLGFKRTDLSKQVQLLQYADPKVWGTQPLVFCLFASWPPNLGAGDDVLRTGTSWLIIQVPNAIGTRSWAVNMPVFLGLLEITVVIISLHTLTPPQKDTFP